MLLKDIINTLCCTYISGPLPETVEVRALCSDSRCVEASALFVALGGEKVDGHAFVAQATGKGATAIIVEQSAVPRLPRIAGHVCVLAVESTHDALFPLSAAFYGNPHHRLRFIGITGTNGKTTISYLLEKLCSDAGMQVGVVGTVSYRYYTKEGTLKEKDAPFTTPDPLTLQQILAEMEAAGVALVIMEVSSHALVQKRIGDILFDVAVFTNLTHEHLDYHRDMERYFAAKSLLFHNHLHDAGTAVIVCHDAVTGDAPSWSDRLLESVKQQGIAVLAVGGKSTCRISLQESSCALQGSSLRVLLDGKTHHLHSPLVGRFNIDNLLAVLGVAVAMKLDLDQSIASLATATGAPGRLQRVFLSSTSDLARIKCEENPAIFVDYAHTPDALLNVLQTLKQVEHRRLICVFGCGGDRDRTKRPAMGRIVSEWADLALITDDNPRTEEPKEIREQIVDGIDRNLMPERGKNYFFKSEAHSGFMNSGTRDVAIACAVQIAGPGDIVVIAGKGHEKYQITRDGKHFFDDVLTVREALMGWSSKDIAQALHCSIPVEVQNQWYSKVSTDTRTLEDGQLFVALQGDTFNGHDYLMQAVEKGATGLVVAESLPGEQEALFLQRKISVFHVDDTLQALGDLASWRRKQIGKISAPLVVGITGSCGKTTVKEMINAIFMDVWPDIATAPLRRVLKTEGNLNNLVGLPLSLLPLQLHHRAAVMEMGMNHPGEIARLAEIADPDICCIVNVRGAHLEGLGSVENVGKAKEELFQYSGQQATLIINLDDPYLVDCCMRYRERKMVCFSTTFHPESCREQGKRPDVWASDISLDGEGRPVFTLHVREEERPVVLPLLGKHNVANGLAAAAIAHAAEIGIDRIAAGLSACTVPARRLEILHDKRGFTVINDTYNANPASMEAGIDTLVSLDGKGKVAILGDMFELGEAGPDLHRDVGRMVGQKGIDYLLVIGSFAQYIVRGAQEGGLGQERIFSLHDKSEVAPIIRNLYERHEITENSSLLVKASRGMHFETIVGDIIEDGSQINH